MILRGVSFSFLFLASIPTVLPSAKGAEIAVAIRYLQAKGTSHSQLFLFREDGTLLRQLTDEKTGQVKRPVFAPGGKAIVFTRAVGQGKSECWSVDPKGENRRRLPEPPAWYRTTTSSDFMGMTNADDEPEFETPDGAQRLIETSSGKGDDCCREFAVQNVKTGESMKIDHWDAKLERIRYGRDVAAVCYGASMYRPGQKPDRITIICKEVGTPSGAPLSGF